MGKKVDISEVIELSEDLKTEASDMKSNLNRVDENIDQLNALRTFSGKAATEAKGYFNDLHKTLLESFNNLFTELDEQLQNNLRAFQSRVDSSDSAIVVSDYLNEIKESVNDSFDQISNEQDRVQETISSVSDITSANNPFTFSLDNNYQGTKKTISDLEGDLESFTNSGGKKVGNIEELLNHIEQAMNRAGAVSGNARFTDYKSTDLTSNEFTSGLQMLKVYNADRHEDVVDRARERKSNAIKDMDEPLQEILNVAFTDLKHGNIDESSYNEVVDELKNIQNGNDSEGEVVSENFIKYIVDNFDDAAGGLRDNAIASYIDNSFKHGGKHFIDRAEVVEKMNGNKPSSTSNYLRDKGNKVLNAGRAVGGGLSVLTLGYGTYTDYQNTDKTLGESFTKNAGATAAGTTSGVAVAGAIKLGALAVGAATPVGWTIAAGVAVGTVATLGFNWAYDNNFLGLQDGLDWAGQQIDNGLDWAGEQMNNAGEYVSGKWNEAQDAVDEGLAWAGETIDSINPFT